MHSSKPDFRPPTNEEEGAVVVGDLVGVPMLVLVVAAIGGGADSMVVVRVMGSIKLLV